MTPVDDHNHALAALRYLISRIDTHHMARDHGARAAAPQTETQPARPRERRWLRYDNEALWTRLW